MKILKKIFFGILFLIVFLFVGFSIYVKIEAKDILAGKLSQVLEHQVTIGDVALIFPFDVQIKNLRIDGKSPAREIHLNIDLISLFDRKIHASRLVLIEPVVHVERGEDKKFVLPEIFPLPEGGNFQSKEPVSKPAVIGEPSAPQKNLPALESEKRALTFSIDQLEIKNGQVSFADRSQASQFQVSLGEVNAVVEHLHFPVNAAINPFQVSGLIIEKGFPFYNSRVNGKGWVDIARKDMDADIKLVEPNGNVGFSSHLKSRDNAMNVKGNIQLKDFGSKFEKPAGSSESMTDFIYGAIRTSGVQVEAAFNFDTKMDDFEVGPVSFSGNIGFNPSASAPSDAWKKAADTAVPDNPSKTTSRSEENLAR